MSGHMAFAIYRPKPGKERELADLVTRHLPLLREHELVSRRDAYLARSSDGSLIEVFEWRDDDASRRAHQIAAVAEIWQAMGEIADFPAMNELPEAAGRFPNFAMGG